MKPCPVCDHILADEEMTCSQCGFSLHPVLGLSVEQANQRLHERRQAWQVQHPVNPQPETTTAQINGVNINSGLVDLEKDPFEKMDEYKKRLETGYWEVGSVRMLVDEYNSEKSIMPIEITLLPVLRSKNPDLQSHHYGAANRNNRQEASERYLIYIVIQRSTAQAAIANQEELLLFGLFSVRNNTDFKLKTLYVRVQSQFFVVYRKLLPSRFKFFIEESVIEEVIILTNIIVGILMFFTSIFLLIWLGEIYRLTGDYISGKMEFWDIFDESSSSVWKYLAIPCISWLYLLNRRSVHAWLVNSFIKVNLTIRFLGD